MRIRPTTWAMIWYPLVCAALAAGFGAWLWTQCADVRRPAACRSDIVPGMGMFFVAILATGMIVLGIIWLVGRLMARGAEDESSRWSDEPSDTASRTGTVDAPSPIDSGSDSDPVRRG